MIENTCLCFGVKTTVGGEKEGEKKEGKPLSPLFSVCSRGARKNKIIQRVQLAVDDTTNCSFLRLILSRESIKRQHKEFLEYVLHTTSRREKGETDTHTHTHTL